MTIDVSASTCVAGLVAGIPLTKTERFSMRSAAASLDRASSRLTNSASNLVFIGRLTYHQSKIERCSIFDEVPQSAKHDH